MVARGSERERERSAPSQHHSTRALARCTYVQREIRDANICLSLRGVVRAGRPNKRLGRGSEKRAQEVRRQLSLPTLRGASSRAQLLDDQAAYGGAVFIEMHERDSVEAQAREVNRPRHSGAGQLLARDLKR